MFNIYYYLLLFPHLSIYLSSYVSTLTAPTEAAHWQIKQVQYIYLYPKQDAVWHNPSSPLCSHTLLVVSVGCARSILRGQGRPVPWQPVCRCYRRHSHSALAATCRWTLIWLFGNIEPCLSHSVEAAGLGNSGYISEWDTTSEWIEVCSWC